MKIRHSYIENSNFSFASMTDVITTLLIFLMLIVSVDNLHHNDKEVKIDLPVSKSAVNCDSENVAVVVMTMLNIIAGIFSGLKQLVRILYFLFVFVVNMIKMDILLD